MGLMFLWGFCLPPQNIWLIVFTVYDPETLERNKDLYSEQRNNANPQGQIVEVEEKIKTNALINIWCVFFLFSSSLPSDINAVFVLQPWQ